MTKVSNVLLSYEDEQAIASAVAEIEDPDVRAVVERKLRHRLTEEASRATKSRNVFRRALTEATAWGLADPEGYALDKCNEALVIDLHNRRLGQIEARRKGTTNRRADKAAMKREAASKTAAVPPRVIPQRDKQYVVIVGAAERDGSLSSPSLVASVLKQKLGVYRLPHWEKTRTALKMMAMALESHNQGAMTFTLRLGPALCQKAMLSPRGPASYVQARIRDELTRALEADAPQFWFIIERDTSQRFHAHGAVVAPPGSAAEPLIKTALQRAGAWEGAAAELYQVEMKPLTHPIGWAAYLCKELNVTSRDIDRKLLASTVGIRRRARDGWDSVRARLPST